MPDRDPVQDGLPGEDRYDVAEWNAHELRVLDAIETGDGPAEP
ncbi:hypothetical protein [Halomicrobium katesii]|nr:hypothetical protein [Halomicrobium katesii]